LKGSKLLITLHATLQKDWTVSRLRKLVVPEISPIGFDPRSFHVRIVEEKVALGNVLRHVHREFISVCPLICLHGTARLLLDRSS
jgi:hypothetical protein